MDINKKKSKNPVINQQVQPKWLVILGTVVTILVTVLSFGWGIIKDLHSFNTNTNTNTSNQPISKSVIVNANGNNGIAIGEVNENIIDKKDAKP